MKKRINILFWFLLTALQTMVAQTYPVTITAQATPPAPIYFSSYANPNAITSPLQVQIVLNDLSIVNREVYLKTYFEGNGISFRSKFPVLGAQPIFIEGGIPLILRNSELAPYFALENIEGISPNVYGEAISEGSYRFCFEIYDALTNARLSRKSCAQIVIFQNEPPFLIIPEDTKSITEQNPLNLLFQWTPRHVNVTNVQYELSIVEIWDSAMNAQAAFFAAPPIFQTTTSTTSYRYGPTDPFLLPNKRYAWRVQAKAIQGAEDIGLFKNNGYSEVYSFTYTEPCDPPSTVTHEVKGAQQANISWEDYTTQIPEFSVRYRQKGAASEWFYSKTTSNWITLWDLKPDTTYEYQVSKNCAVTQSSYSILKTFTTLLTDDVAGLFDCGISPDLNIESMEPLPILNTGNTFTAGDFTVKVLETSGSEGRYTGTGYIKFPAFNNIKVAVNFTNIFINDDSELAEGMVITVYDPTWSNILDVDKAIDTVLDIVDVVTGNTNTEIPQLDYDIVTTDIDVVEDKITIKKPDGKQDSYEYDKGKTYTITDKSGDEWTIDKNGKVTQTGKGDPTPPLTVSNTDGLHEGTHSGTLEDPAVAAITNELLEITFSKDPDSTFFALDQVNNPYERENYFSLGTTKGGTFYPPHKATVAGTKDTFLAEIKVLDDKINLDSLIIKTIKNKSIAHQRIAGTNTFKIRVASHNAYRTEECVITYLDPDTKKYKIAASFFVHHLKKQLEVPVQVVSVHKSTEDTDFATDLRDTAALNSDLNEIFGAAGANFKVQPEVVSLGLQDSDWDTQEDNDIIDYDGSGLLSDYPQELRNIIKTFKAQNPSYNAGQYYVFVLSDDFEVSKPLSGFMPKTRQFGFVFERHLGNGLEKKDSATKVAAHELGHGVYTLAHPFGDNFDNAGLTDNTWLMDYGTGTELGYPNWATMNDSKLKLFLFQDDKGGELLEKGITGYLSINENKWNNYSFLSPIGTAILIEKASHVKFNEDGAVINFKVNNERYLGVISRESQKFIGYIHENKKEFVQNFKGLTKDFIKEFEKHRFTGIKYAPLEQTIYSIAKKRSRNTYLNCIIEARWPNQIISNNYVGIAKPPFIPKDVLTISREGNQCGDAEANGVLEGPGVHIFYAFDQNIDNNEKHTLIKFSNYITEKLENKTFAFYTDESQMQRTLNSFPRLLQYLKDNNIYSIEKFNSKEHFPVETFARDAEIIFSRIDLREDIVKEYNKNSIDWELYRKDNKKVRYEYSLADLESRIKIMNDNSVYRSALVTLESNGNAEAISMSDGYKQYVALFGTDSAIYSWSSFAANSSKDVLMAYFSYRLIAQHGIAIMQELGKEGVKRFLRGALEEGLGNIIAHKILSHNDPIPYSDFIEDMMLAGFKEVLNPSSQLISAGFDCLTVIDQEQVTNMLTSKNDQEFYKNLKITGAQCAIPVVLEQVLPRFKDYLLKNKIFLKNGYLFFKNKMKLGTPETVQFLKILIDFDNLFKNKSDFYKETIEKILTKKSGVTAIDVLIKAGYNIPSLSAKSIERLSNIIENYGLKSTTELDELSRLFKETIDVSRMLIFLDNTVSSIAEYKKVIEKIRKHEMFEKIIILNNKTIKVSEFFTAKGQYDYFYKVEGNKHYFVKVLEKKEGMLIVVDKTADIVIGSITNVTKDWLFGSFEDYLDKQE